jgi:O-antigen ligase
MTRGRSSLLLWRLPIIWFFMGPPVFRTGFRGAAASLEGSFDAWNIMRVVWWGVFGLLALYGLKKNGREVGAFLRSLGSMPWWVMIWLGSLFLSVLASPAPLFTIANALSMLLLVLAATDLGLKLFLGQVTYIQVLRLMNGVALGLMLLVVVTFLVSPWMVSIRNVFGPRIMGGQVAEFASLGMLVVFASLSLALASRHVARVSYLMAVGLGLVAIMYSQTRTAYVLTALGLAFFAVQWFVKIDGRRKKLMLASACGLVVFCAALVLSVEISGNMQPMINAAAFLQRNPDSIQSMSGRDGMSALILREVAANPLGLGYAAGPRMALMSNEAFLSAYGVVAVRIGDAHNMYLEILGGSGIVGAVAWIAILLLTGTRMAADRGSLFIPIRTMYFVVLGFGITGSSGALPFTQVSVMLWMLIALATTNRDHESSVNPQSLSAVRW